MRSILLGLMLTSSFVTAALVLGPDMYGGCASTHDIGKVVIVLVAMPLLMLIANHGCHRAAMSPRNSKLVLAPLILAYYLPIVLFDSRTHVMEGTIVPSCVVNAPSCVAIETAPHHATDSMMLVDVACNFFVCACLLETWRTRALHVLCHVTLWAWDNTNYPKYVSLGTPAQRVWLWAGFFAVEAQMMATIIAIAIGIDTLWASQRAQARLEVRLFQMASEKERLAWEAKLDMHRAANLQDKLLRVYTPFEIDASSSTTSELTEVRSHYTAKLGEFTLRGEISE
jgi:hypothetical protein